MPRKYKPKELFQEISFINILDLNIINSWDFNTPVPGQVGAQGDKNVDCIERNTELDTANTK
jgi:hypothetical protein